jgi:rhamnose transport system ATP-binding protein
VLELEQFGCRAAGVHEIQLDVRMGEILGLAGLVGAGRTELARVLFGVTPADHGVMRLHGDAVRITSPRQAYRHGIAYVPEDRRRHGVILPMSVQDNTTLAILSQLNDWRGLDTAREREIATTFVRRLMIKTDSLSTPVGELSGGNQQKVALSRWLAIQPHLLILDEPTQGIDVGAKAEIHEQIRRLAASGLSILLISSELPEVLGLSDRVAVMHRGRIAAVLDRADATAEKVLALALGEFPLARSTA